MDITIRKVDENYYEIYDRDGHQVAALTAELITEIYAKQPCVWCGCMCCTNCWQDLLASHTARCDSCGCDN